MTESYPICKLHNEPMYIENFQGKRDCITCMRKRGVTEFAISEMYKDQLKRDMQPNEIYLSLPKCKCGNPITMKSLSECSECIEKNYRRKLKEHKKLLELEANCEKANCLCIPKNSFELVEEHNQNFVEEE